MLVFCNFTKYISHIRTPFLLESLALVLIMHRWMAECMLLMPCVLRASIHTDNVQGSR